MQQLQIPYSVGRKNLGRVKNVVQTWGTMVKKFQTPTRTKESFKDYLKLSRDEKNKLKNVDGYFFAAQCEDGSRKREAVKARALLTLDLDANAAKIMSEIDMGLSGISGYEFFTHGTRSHTEKDPSLRIVIPLARMIEPDEHAPLSRIVSSWVDPTMRSIDPITHRLAQMMYLPSVSRDSDYYFMYNEGDLLDPDDIIQKWEDEHGADALHNLDTLPKNPDLEGDLRDSHVKAEWPLDKAGIVGQWCRAYEDIETTIEVWLQDYYEPADHSGTDVRYIPVGSSGGAGAIIYDGQWMYSNHTTDPCAGQLVNSFDIVRLCKFGDQDPDDIRDIKVTDLPSWKAMTDFAEKDERRADQEKSERYGMIGQLSDDDEDTSEPDTEADTENDTDRMLGLLEEESGDLPKQQDVGEVDPGWTAKLDTTKNGDIIANLYNTRLVCQNDNRFRGLWARNELSGLNMQTRDLKTRIPEIADILLKDKANGDEWSEDGNAIVALMISQSNHAENPGYGFKPLKEDLQTVITGECLMHTYHPLQDHFTNLKPWDGVKRCGTVFHRYMGTPDDAYHAEVFTIAMVASVTRLFEPGAKYDQMVVLEGGEGARKSTFIRELGMNKYFREYTADMADPKVIIENTRGAFFVELAELNTYRKSDMEEQKTFLSSSEDRARAAFGRAAETVKRQWTIWGSTNDSEYLKARSGNRRIFPVRLDDKYDIDNPIDIDAFVEELPLLQAEALAIYRQMRIETPDRGKDLHLDIRSHEARTIAKGKREDALMDTTESILAGEIDHYYSEPIPLSVIVGGDAADGFDDVMVLRTAICTKHVFEALKNGHGRNMSRQEAMEISGAISQCKTFSAPNPKDDWPRRIRFKNGGYGLQTVYYRNFTGESSATPQDRKNEYMIVENDEFDGLV